MRTFQMIVLSFALLAGLGCKPEDARVETEGTKHPAAGTAKPAAGAAAAAGAGGDAAKGEAVYAKVCGACHGKDGRGNGGVTGPDFSKDNRFTLSDAELIKSVSEGKQGKVGVMPPQKNALSEAEIKDAVAYMRGKFGG